MSFEDFDMAMSESCKCGHLRGEHVWAFEKKATCCDDKCTCEDFETD